MRRLFCQRSDGDRLDIAMRSWKTRIKQVRGGIFALKLFAHFAAQFSCLEVDIVS